MPSRFRVFTDNRTVAYGPVVLPKTFVMRPTGFVLEEPSRETDFPISFLASSRSMGFRTACSDTTASPPTIDETLPIFKTTPTESASPPINT